MTTSALLSRLKVEEGLRLQAYPDPESAYAQAEAEGRSPIGLSGAPWTIGYGHTRAIWPQGGSPRMIQEGDTCDIAQAEAWLKDDVALAEQHLDQGAPWWRSLDDVRQDVLVDMCFNLGWGTLSTFAHFLAALRSGDYARAASEMLWNVPPDMSAEPPMCGIPTRWAKQVGARADRLARLMRYGAAAMARPAKVVANVG